MYPVSESMLDVIRGDDRSFQWIGDITLQDGTVVGYGMENIVQGTGSIRSSCQAPGIGETVATELTMQMYLDIEVERLKNAVIGMTCRVTNDNEDTAVNLSTWGDASTYQWIDINGSQWGESTVEVAMNIPVGVFNVNKAKRTTNSIKITAYDNMQKFDTEMPELTNLSALPYAWLDWMCRQVGVQLGMDYQKFRELPNSNRHLTVPAADANIKTYRELLSMVTTLLGGVAMIDRYGKLIIVPCVSEPVLELTPSDRFSSEFEDYKTYHTGIYSQYKAGGVQEYCTNAESGYDTGSIIDLGCNPFMQISASVTRRGILQDLINLFKDFPITPFETTIPYDPTLDLMDVISFTGEHAPSNAQAPITDMTIGINGYITIRCEIAETAAGLLRTDKTIDSVSGDTSSGASYASNDFWLQIASFPNANKDVTEETVTTSIDIEFTIKPSKTQVTWTGFYTLSADATVTAKVQFEGATIYEISDVQTSGMHVLNVTTGHIVDTDGTLNYRVLISASDGATISMPKDGARMTVLGIGNSVIDAGDALTEEGQLAKDIADNEELLYPPDVDWDKEAEELGLSSNSKHMDENGNWVDGDDYNNAATKFKQQWPTKEDASGTVPKVKQEGGKSYVSLDQREPAGNTSPYSIKVTTNPDNVKYDSGDQIDVTGMVVTAYTITGDVWDVANYPNGIVPLGEITISPTKAP